MIAAAAQSVCGGDAGASEHGQAGEHPQQRLAAVCRSLRAVELVASAAGKAGDRDQ